ncbi:MAG TPA: serine/threonine-protein kinase [Burkholderiales bacterium]|nr:serine/threonine-protein kinase [Burkholderiales bacterium]
MTTPHHLGKYEITEVLGQGAMGVVYKGFDPGIRRTVAIKTIRRELIEGERAAAAMLARFRNEAQAAGKLAHPGIVAVYDYGEEGSVAYIAMEYVEGNSLREYIGRGTRFAERDAVSIMSQLLEALAHAHERRVWHRDIKPGNVIVMRNGRVKVADFGIARIEASELTQTGVMMGSPGYMAPEQYAAAQIDHRADLFAAGVVFYQLITGAKPFVGTAEQVSYATCHTEPLRASLADPSKGWERYDPVIAKALSKKPEDRFQSAEGFRAAVLAAHDAPAAAAVSEETIIVEVLRPAAAVELSGSPHQKQGPVPRPAAEPAAPARPRRWMIGAAAVLVTAAAGFAIWRAGSSPVAPQDHDVQAQLAKARAEADEATRRAKTAAAAAEEARRQLEAERAAEAKARAAGAEAKVKPAPNRVRSPAEEPTRREEPPVAVARRDPEPLPKPAAPPAQEQAPRSTWGVLFGSPGPQGTPVAAATRYDGAWTATRSCETYEELPVQVATSNLSVKGGEFVVVVGTPGQPGYSLARGRPNDDGLLTMRGDGLAISKRFLGMSHPVYFRGRADGDRFTLKGTLGDRNCSLVLARR